MVPVVYLLQFSPFEYRRALLDGAQQRNIVVEAYSPLGQGADLNAAPVQVLAAKYGATPAQIVLAWHLSHGDRKSVV